MYIQKPLYITLYNEPQNNKHIRQKIGKANEQAIKNICVANSKHMEMLIFTNSQKFQVKKLSAKQRKSRSYLKRRKVSKSKDSTNCTSSAE